MRLEALLILLAAASTLPAAAAAAAPGAKGRAIAEKVDRSDSGWGDEVVSGVLTIRSPDGAETRRVFEMSTLEKVPGGDKRAVVFKEPRDLAGFVSLNHSALLEPDDQWIYLPQMKRTRRLSARDKTGSFAGSEFSYEDIVRWELGKYDYAYVGQADCGDGRICEVIEDVPLYPYSGYSKLIETIDMSILQPRKIVYYDTSGRPFKELELTDYERVGGYWRPRRTRMTNIVTGAVSEIEWSPYSLGNGLSDSAFRVERIEDWAR